MAFDTRSSSGGFGAVGGAGDVDAGVDDDVDAGVDDDVDAGVDDDVLVMANLRWSLFECE